MAFALALRRSKVLLAGWLLLATAACSGGVTGQPPEQSRQADAEGIGPVAAQVAPVIGPGYPLPDVPAFAPTPLTAALRACLPARLHPVSRQFLNLWLESRIGTRTFRRFFHMPNSDYLPVGECLLRERERMAAGPRRVAPA